MTKVAKSASKQSGVGDGRLFRKLIVCECHEVNEVEFMLCRCGPQRDDALAAGPEMAGMHVPSETVHIEERDR